MLDPLSMAAGAIFGSGKGSSVEVESLSVNANGTYTAEEGKAYSPVTVNVPAPRSPIFSWDFMSATPLVDTVRGETAIASDVTFGSSGAVFSSNQKGFIVLSSLAQSFTIEVDIAELNLTTGTAGRLLQVAIGNGKGLNYRGSGVWAVYNGSINFETEITDPLFFSGHMLKIRVDENRKWHIYRDDELVFEPNTEMSMERYSGVSNITVYIGSAATSIYNAVISAVRVY